MEVLRLTSLCVLTVIFLIKATDSCVKCQDGFWSSQSTDYNCTEAIGNCYANYFGGYGDKQCQKCPQYYIGNQSSTLLSDCHRVNAICKSGYYSYEESCFPCPVGYSSQDYEAVKIEDCFRVNNVNCPIGKFGYNSSCSMCPYGKTSESHKAVKVEDCFAPANNNCIPGYYGFNFTCELCPMGTFSREGEAVKESDCIVEKDLDCGRGEYKSGGDCLNCPKGSTSNKHQAAKVEDCIRICREYVEEDCINERFNNVTPDSKIW